MNLVAAIQRDTNPGIYPWKICFQSQGCSCCQPCSTRIFMGAWHFLRHGGTLTCEVQLLLSFAFYAWCRKGRTLN